MPIFTYSLFCNKLKIHCNLFEVYLKTLLGYRAM
jgi:hypothetical protein